MGMIRVVVAVAALTGHEIEDATEIVDGTEDEVEDEADTNVGAGITKGAIGPVPATAEE